jgi:hypothetical protein
MHGAVYFDGKRRAVGQVDLGVDVACLAVRLSAQHLVARRRQAGATDERGQADLGQGYARRL